LTPALPPPKPLPDHQTNNQQQNTMKNHTILTALAVLAAALAHPAQAEFTRHGGQAHTKGEVTHLNGVALPPITTAAQARAETEKRLAAIKATEAKAAAASAALDTRHSSLATGPQDIFYTGKPYLQETGQYVFLFRHYDPELGRWTTSDPSGFPDGANNVAYMAVPTTEFDWQGLAVVSINVNWMQTTLPEILDSQGNVIQRGQGVNRSEIIDLEYQITGNYGPNPSIRILGWSYQGEPVRSFINGNLLGGWSIGPIEFSLASTFTFTQDSTITDDGHPAMDVRWQYTNGGSIGYKLSNGSVNTPVSLTIVSGNVVDTGTTRISAVRVVE
jgi:RHS repeat-associated protein